MSNHDKGLGSSLEKLQKAEAQVLQLREEFEKERQQQLEQLHGTLGFASRGELIEALQALGGGPRRRGRPKSGSGNAPAGDGAAGARASKRARITPEMQAGIIKALRAGERGVAVAARFGISGLSLHKIKKAAGLVRRSKK
jgi:hypothetical protein